MALDTPLIRPDAATQASASAAYGQLSLSFGANQGQTDAQVNFLSRGSGYTFFLTPGGAVLDLQKGTSDVDVVRMQLVGANTAAAVVGLDELPGRSNYLVGDDPATWQTVTLPQASLGGPAGVFVVSTPASQSAAGSAPDASAPLLVLPTDETRHQANPFARPPLAESRAQPESSSARGETRDAVVPTLVSHVAHRLKSRAVFIEAMDAVFDRGDWLPDVLMSKQALDAIG